MYRTRKYKVNENYFRVIDNQTKAYWLGYLYADGSLVNPQKKSYSVSLHSIDYELLYKFKKSIKSQHLIRKDLNRNTYYLRITSKQVFNSLIRRGMRVRPLEFPKIDIYLYRHFIRGFFDGDGWVSQRPNKKNGTFGLANKSTNLLLSIQEYLINILHFNKLPLTKTPTCYCLEYGGRKQLMKLYGLLYYNSKTFLNRKKKKFKSIVDF